LIYTGERAIPWNPHTGIAILNAHVRRYAWALPFVAGKKVVDLGCGCGYGTFMLSWAASQAFGVDVDQEAVAFASKHFQALNLHYAVTDITEKCFDGEVYVAFEVLEHLDDPAAIIERYRPLVWSMPIDDGSAFHKRAYSLDDIYTLTEKHQLEDRWATWIQGQSGRIVERGRCDFDIIPAYVLGFLE
jgi:SAM-dependent methyltransferase